VSASKIVIKFVSPCFIAFFLQILTLYYNERAFFCKEFFGKLAPLIQRKEKGCLLWEKAPKKR
jgi:hypothetical protein